MFIKPESVTSQETPALEPNQDGVQSPTKLSDAAMFELNSPVKNLERRPSTDNTNVVAHKSLLLSLFAYLRNRISTKNIKNNEANNP